MTLEVFVPGRLQNTANGSLSHAHWSARSSYAKWWRYEVAGRVRLATKRAGWTIAPEIPKHIRLVALVSNRLDKAGLASALKPVEDGLQTERIQMVRGVPRLLPGAGIIDDDGPQYPHVITHDQEIARPRKRDPKARFSPTIDPRGVRITITLQQELSCSSVSTSGGDGNEHDQAQSARSIGR